MKRTTVFFSMLLTSILVLALGTPTAWALDTKIIAEAAIGPGTKALTFAVTGSPESVSLKIVNGSAKGVDRVSSAVITLNGEQLYSQKDFNQNVASLVMSLGKDLLKAESNKLEVSVQGRAAAFLKVTIEAAYPDVIIATPPPPPPAPVPTVAWYFDADGDGFGAGTPTMLPVGAPSPGLSWTTQAGDCNDADPTIYPGNGCR